MGSFWPTSTASAGRVHARTTDVGPNHGAESSVHHEQNHWLVGGWRLAPAVLPTRSLMATAGMRTAAAPRCSSAGTLRSVLRPYPWWPAAAYPVRVLSGVRCQRRCTAWRSSHGRLLSTSTRYYAGIVDDFDGFFQRLTLPPGQHDITLYLEGYRTIDRRSISRPVRPTRFSTPWRRSGRRGERAAACRAAARAASSSRQLYAAADAAAEPRGTGA